MRALEIQLSLAEFVREFWPFFHSFDIRWNWHIDVICDHLQAVTEGRIQYLLANIPPGMMKSLLVSVFWPAWVWLSKPSHQFLAVSGTPSVALRDAVRMRDLVQCGHYQEIVRLLNTEFKPWGIDRSQKRKSYFTNTKNGHRISLSTGSKVTGLRGDTRIIDDPLDAAELNPVMIQQGNDWYDTVLSTRENTPDSSEVVIMQRLNENDLSGHLTRRGTHEHLIIPAETVEGAVPCSTSLWTDPGKVGDLMFPSFLTRASLDAKAEQLGSRAYAAQYLQTPVPLGGAVFRYDWFKWHNHVDVPAAPEITAWSWDMTFKKTKDSDYVVGQYWVVKGPNKYLIEQIRARMDLADVRREVRAAVTRRPANVVLVENTSNGPAIIEMLRHDTPYTVIPIDPQGNSKESRAAVAAVECEAGHVWLPDPTSPINRWVNSDLLNELCSFPAGRHDDQVDAFSQFLVWVTQSFSQPWTRSRRGKT